MSAANQITSRNRGHKVQVVIGELDQYIRGWLNYYKLSSTYKEVLALSVWVRRRVRLYYWQQWKQPRTRRRHLLSLGADPATVHMATRSRKGYWRMSQNEIVRFALNNRWLEEQGVPDMRAIWIALYYPEQAQGNWLEPPCTEPYAGWCGTGELITPRDPILLFDSLAIPDTDAISLSYSHLIFLWQEVEALIEEVGQTVPCF